LSGQKWADVDEDDDDSLGEQNLTSNATRFETQADDKGIKTVIEYKERDGKMYKVTKKVKARIITHWTNKFINERKQMKKFGKPLNNDPGAEKSLIVKSEDDVNIEISKKLQAQVVAKDDAEDKFHEESIRMAEQITKEKKVWTDINRERQMDRDAAPEKAEEKPAEKAAEPAPAATGGKNEPSKYVPPSLRTAARPGEKGDGKGNQMQAQQEASLRITNLSEDVREGDLQDLFGQFGRLQRVYLAKDMATQQSRGFAFVTYWTREDAQRAIKNLNGHGYDNLILQVQFAKPRA